MDAQKGVCPEPGVRPPGAGLAMTGFPMHARLANELARRFVRRPVTDAAPELAEFLRIHWDSRMLLALCAHLDSTDDGVEPLLAAAVVLLRDRGDRGNRGHRRPAG